MGEPTSRQATRPQQQRKTVRFACDETDDETEVDDRSPSLGPFLAFDIPTTSSTTKPQEPDKAVEPSLQMVPYVPRSFGQASTAMMENHPKHPLFNLLSNDHLNHQLLRASSVPRHVLISEAGPSTGLGFGGPELELGSVSPLVSFLSNELLCACWLQTNRTRGPFHTFSNTCVPRFTLRQPATPPAKVDHAIFWVISHERFEACAR